MKLKKDKEGQEAPGSVHVKADDHIKELEDQIKTDIVRFKRIYSLDPVNYIKPGSTSLGIVKAFREAQQIAFNRLVDLKVIDPQTGKGVK